MPFSIIEMLFFCPLALHLHHDSIFQDKQEILCAPWLLIFPRVQLLSWCLFSHHRLDNNTCQDGTLHCLIQVILPFSINQEPSLYSLLSHVHDCNSMQACPLIVHHSPQHLFPNNVLLCWSLFRRNSRYNSNGQLCKKLLGILNQLLFAKVLFLLCDLAWHHDQNSSIIPNCLLHRDSLFLLLFSKTDRLYWGPWQRPSQSSSYCPFSQFLLVHPYLLLVPIV